MKIVIATFLLILSISCNAQFNFRNLTEINYDFGFSNDLGDKTFYNSTSSSDKILVEKRSFVSTSNITVGYTRFFNPKNGIKASFGISKFGFQIKGVSDLTGTKFNNPYTVSHLEWGLSYVRSIPISSSRNIIVEPGLRYHSDGSPRSNGISITRKDSFTFSLYSGYELPMAGNNFYTTIGIQIKLPLEAYNFNLNNREQKDYYPYFIGLKLGINFQFQAF